MSQANSPPGRVRSLGTNRGGEGDEELTEQEPPALHREAGKLMLWKEKKLETPICQFQFLPGTIYNDAQNRTLSRQSSILVTTTLQYFWFPIDRIGLLSGRIILLVNLKESIVIHVDNPLDN